MLVIIYEPGLCSQWATVSTSTQMPQHRMYETSPWLYHLNIMYSIDFPLSMCGGIPYESLWFSTMHLICDQGMVQRYWVTMTGWTFSKAVKATWGVNINFTERLPLNVLTCNYPNRPRKALCNPVTMIDKNYTAVSGLISGNYVLWSNFKFPLVPVSSHYINQRKPLI